MSENVFQTQSQNLSKTDYRLTLQQPSSAQMLFPDDIQNQFKSNLKASAFNQTNDRLQSNSLALENEPKVQEYYILMKIKASETEDRNEQMKVTIITSYTKKQTIQIQITNPKDPLVLYTLDMGEMEFHQLKNEQSLFVVFQEFPGYLKNMFELCDNNTYICILHKRNPTEALLIVQQRNQFRELNHLILNLTQANDALLKKFLGSLSAEYKFKFEAACDSIEKLTEEIAKVENENRALNEQLQKERISSQSSLDTLINEKNKELNQLKEECFTESKSKLNELEEVKNRKIEELEGRITDIHNRYEELLNEKKQVEEYRMKLEMKLKDLEGKHAIANTELNVYKEDIINLRQDNSALNQKCFKQEKEITELRFMNDNLQKQIEEKEKNITNLNHLSETLSKQRESNDDIIKGMKASNSKLEEKLQISINEINKGNEIIEKIQTELKATKAKAKAKQQALSTQEELTTQKQSLLDDQIRIVNELKRNKDAQEMEIISLNKQLSGYQSKLQENEKLIEKNKEMIMYLNQKLNENYNPFTGGNNTNSNFNNFHSTNPKMQVPGVNSGLGGYTNYSSEQLGTSNNFNSNNNNNLQSSNGSGMLIMPETNFCNYKPNMKGDKYMMNNTAHSSTGVNLLNHKYGMMTSSLSNKNLDGSGSGASMIGYRNEESINNTNSNMNIPSARTYQMEEEYPRQMTQPQRTINQKNK